MSDLISYERRHVLGSSEPAAGQKVEDVAGQSSERRESDDEPEAEVAAVGEEAGDEDELLAFDESPDKERGITEVGERPLHRGQPSKV
jgi:hypothetical protein